MNRLTSDDEAADSDKASELQQMLTAAASMMPELAALAKDEDGERQEEILRKAWPLFSVMMFEYLKTPAGEKIAGRASDLIDALKQRTVSQQAAESAAKHRRDSAEIHWRHALFILVVLLAGGLAIIDKLDGVVATLLSAGLGYLFGKGQRS